MNFYGSFSAAHKYVVYTKFREKIISENVWYNKEGSKDL